MKLNLQYKFILYILYHIKKKKLITLTVTGRLRARLGTRLLLRSQKL